jgi:hypothetical protein
MADVDSNNKDVIDRLLKIKNNIPMHRHANSVIYVFGSCTMNNILFCTMNNFKFVCNNLEILMFKIEIHIFQKTDCIFGRKELGNIATNFKKVII